MSVFNSKPLNETYPVHTVFINLYFVSTTCRHNYIKPPLYHHESLKYKRFNFLWKQSFLPANGYMLFQHLMWLISSNILQIHDSITKPFLLLWVLYVWYSNTLILFIHPYNNITIFSYIMKITNQNTANLTENRICLKDNRIIIIIRIQLLYNIFDFTFK